MSRFIIFWLFLVTLGRASQSGLPRFVINDDTFTDQITRAGERLLREHKLLPLESLREQVHTKGTALRLATVSSEKLENPDLYDRLRASTLAVGTFYKCPECGNWHFSSSAGFVVSGDGIVCTCCHVLLEEDEQIKESYLLAADGAGHVFPVQSVLAADPEADTCLIRIKATGLKPLPLRPGIRPGETVYCLSHPGGYFFMFTQGLVSRVNERTHSDTDEHEKSDRTLSRPILLLNITAEFAPGSSGAPVVDSCGNVVGQVASIAEAGGANEDEENQTTTPSVPVRFCTAAEEILRLTNPNLAKESRSGPGIPTKKPKQKVRQLRNLKRCPLLQKAAQN
jgi:hypothetical protein